MASEGLILDPEAVRVLVGGVEGPVGKDMTKRTLAVHAAAVRGCPVDTGRLRSSLRWTFGRDEHGLVGLVGTDVEYAVFVHEGTRFMAGRPFLTDALREAAAPGGSST